MSHPSQVKIFTTPVCYFSTEKIPTIMSKSSSDGQTTSVREGEGKSEGGKGGDVGMGSEDGGTAGLKVKSDATMEENGASSTTPSTIDFSL